MSLPVEGGRSAFIRPAALGKGGTKILKSGINSAYPESKNTDADLCRCRREDCPI
jgi:hypothetical protein